MSLAQIETTVAGTAYDNVNGVSIEKSSVAGKHTKAVPDDSDPGYIDGHVAQEFSGQGQGTLI